MSSVKKPVGFFAYGILPHSIPATIKAAIESINKSQQVELVSWETLNIGGKYIVTEICDMIDDADFFCADVTTINPNVMYEIGFAIARDKRVWLIRDDSYVDSKSEFNQLQLLTTIGYRSYTNVDQIVKAFFGDNPHLTLEDTIFRSLANTSQRTRPNAWPITLSKQPHTWTSSTAPRPSS